MKVIGGYPEDLGRHFKFQQTVKVTDNIRDNFQPYLQQMFQNTKQYKEKYYYNCF